MIPPRKNNWLAEVERMAKNENVERGATLGRAAF
jgi:hypothetical protein